MSPAPSENEGKHWRTCLAQLLATWSLEVARGVRDGDTVLGARPAAVLLYRYYFIDNAKTLTSYESNITVQKKKFT